VPFVNKIKLTGVTVDNHLSFDQHVSGVVRSCNYYMRSLCHKRPLIDRETAVNLACSVVASRLDYCNYVLYGVTQSDTNIAKLQRLQNSVAGVVCKSPYNTHVTELLRKLHWLPVRQRITYKVEDTIHFVREIVSNLVICVTHLLVINVL
jgi:hypothetical protein